MSPCPEAGARLDFVSVYFTISLFIQLLSSLSGSQGSTGQVASSKTNKQSWTPTAALWCSTKLRYTWS